MQSRNSNESVTMLPAEKRIVGVAALIAMLRMFGLFALLPVLSLYAANLDGTTPLLIGLAVGAYGLTQAALQIPLGMLSDKIGRRPVIIGGLVVFALGSIVAAMGDSIQMVIVGRLLQGAGAISATLSALITDGTREEIRTRSMAVFGIGIGLSFVIALIVGPLIAAYAGVQSLFWLAALLAVVSAVLLRLIPQDIERPVAQQAWSLRPAIRPELLRLDFYVT
jgi:MFS family permease